MREEELTTGFGQGFIHIKLFVLSCSRIFLSVRGPFLEPKETMGNKTCGYRPSPESPEGFLSPVETVRDLL